MGFTGYPRHPQDGQPVAVRFGKKWDVSQCQILTPAEAVASVRMGLPVLGRIPHGVWIDLSLESPTIERGSQWLFSTFPIEVKEHVP